VFVAGSNRKARRSVLALTPAHRHETAVDGESFGGIGEMRMRP